MMQFLFLREMNNSFSNIFVCQYIAIFPPCRLKVLRKLFDDKIIEKEVLDLVSDNVDESGIEEDWKVGDV